MKNIKNQNVRFFLHGFVPLLAVSTMVISGCGAKTAADPKTVLKSDLNPPARLVSVTSDQEMILQWTITNTEDDLVGYNVYVAEGDMATLQAKVTAGIFKGLDLKTQQVRRCADTADLFSQFGFKADAKQAKESCDDFTDKDSKTETDSAKSAAAAPSDRQALADDAKTVAGSFVKCKGLDGTEDLGGINENLKLGISVAISKAKDVDGVTVPTDLAKRVGLELSCVLPNDTLLSDGKKGFVNGKSYVAFVVAVKGKAGEEISYTSNFIEDSPAKYTAFSFSTLQKSQFLKVPIKSVSGKITGELTKTDFANTDLSDCKAGSCKIGDLVKDANDGDKTISGLAFAIVADETNKSERLFLGGSDKVTFLNAKPRNDYAEGSAGPGKARDGIKEPGDLVLPYTQGGNLYEAGNQSIVPGSLFFVSIQGEAPAERFYGKLYFSSVATDYAGAADAAGTGNRSFKAILALQPAANSVFAQILAKVTNPAASWMVR